MSFPSPGGSANTAPSTVGVNTTHPQSGGPMSPEQFRELYVANMRKKFEETRQRQAAGLPPGNPAMAPRPRETMTEVPPLFRAVPHNDDANGNHVDAAHMAHPAGRGAEGGIQWKPIINMLLQIAFAAFVFSQGDTGKTFLSVFSILVALKVATFALSKLKLQRHRAEGEENDLHGAGGRAGLLAGRAKLWYILWKSVVTFFVAMHPSFRVEALEMELRMDGIDHSAAAVAPPPAAAHEAARDD